jgi:thioredoxin-like negative regulator of GroEL
MTCLFFTADWCSVCRTVRPLIEKLQATGYEIRIVNTDQEKEFSAKFNVTALPTTIILQDSRELKRFVGKISEGTLRTLLTKKIVEYKIY